MKRLLTAITLVGITALLTSASATAQWNTVPVSSRQLPGAAEFDSKLWIFFNRTADGQIGYVTTTNIDGGPFSAETILPTGAVQPRPAAVMFNNRLYLFYAEGVSPSRLFYRSIGTTGTWSLEQQVPGASTNARPGLAVFNNQLYIVWEPAGASDNRIKYATMSTTESFSGVQSPAGLTTRGPAAAVYNNRLYVIYTGESGPPWNLYHVWMDTSGTWSSHFAVGGSPKSWAPISAGPFRGLLQLFYTGASTYRLLNKNLNTSGLWSPEFWLAGLGAYDGTSAANFGVRQWVFSTGNGVVWYIVLS